MASGVFGRLWSRGRLWVKPCPVALRLPGLQNTVGRISAAPSGKHFAPYRSIHTISPAFSPYHHNGETFMIAVLFEAKAAPAHQARYLQLAAELKPLLADIDGFIDIERFQSLTTDGKILSLSWWRDERPSAAGSRMSSIRPRRPKAGRRFFLSTVFAWRS